jgi:hypothetical protein
MIERTEQQDRIDGLASLRKGPGVVDLSAGEGRLRLGGGPCFRLLDVQRHGID